MSFLNKIIDILSKVAGFCFVKPLHIRRLRHRMGNVYASLRTIAPITVGDLKIGDIYLHVVVQTDLGLRIEEFTPHRGVRKSGDRYTPDLLVIDTFDPTSGKREARFVEELGLMPSDRTNLHRVFRATMEARQILYDFVVEQNTKGYVDLILPTLTEAEECRLSIDGLFESIAENSKTTRQTYDRHFDDLGGGKNGNNKDKKQ